MKLITPKKIIMQLKAYSYKATDETPEHRPAILLQPVDSHDLEELQSEVDYLTAHATASFVLVAVPVKRWFDELSPWPAPPVFGKTAFGNGAPRTLDLLLKSVIPAVVQAKPLCDDMQPGQGRYSVIDVPDTADRSACSATVNRSAGSDVADVEAASSAWRVILGGYSLAGLFSFWAGTQHTFSAVVGASPSVWFRDWISFAMRTPMRAGAVYLSLGDRESHTRTPLLATVDDCIHQQLEIIQAQHIPVALEMNPGNHFQDNGIRTAKGFVWAMEPHPRALKRAAPSPT